jgi:hypothetical protein
VVVVSAVADEGPEAMLEPAFATVWGAAAAETEGGIWSKVLPFRGPKGIAGAACCKAGVDRFVLNSSRTAARAFVGWFGEEDVIEEAGFESELQ